MVYLLQVIVYTALMYVVYILFLRNRPMHGFNRAYLLASAILPPALPFIQLSQGAATSLQQATLQGIRLPEIVVAKHAQGPVVSVLEIAVAIYLLVIAAILLFKARQWYKLKQVINNNEKIHEQGYTLVINSGYGPGSWWKYIFIPAEETNDSIIDHERAHIQLRHTVDVMLLDILQMFFWPNLLLIWLRRELVQVHEFQADAMAATEKHVYAQLLVSSLFHTCTLPSSHSFIIHPIKRRIKMLNKKKRLAPRIVAMLATGIAATLLLVNIIAIQSCNTKKWDADTKGKKISSPSDAVLQHDKTYHFFKGTDTTLFAETGKYVEFKADDVKNKVHKMPAFPGNMAEFMAKTIVYPKPAIDKGAQGRVIVTDRKSVV